MERQSENTLMMFIIGVGRTGVESTKVAVKWDFKVVSSSTTGDRLTHKNCVCTQFTFVRVPSDTIIARSVACWSRTSLLQSNNVVYVVNSFCV